MHMYTSSALVVTTKCTGFSLIEHLMMNVLHNAKENPLLWQFYRYVYHLIDVIFYFKVYTRKKLFHNNSSCLERTVYLEVQILCATFSITITLSTIINLSVLCSLIVIDISKTTSINDHLPCELNSFKTYFWDNWLISLDCCCWYHHASQKQVNRYTCI